MVDTRRVAPLVYPFSVVDLIFLRYTCMGLVFFFEVLKMLFVGVLTFVGATTVIIWLVLAMILTFNLRNFAPWSPRVETYNLVWLFSMARLKT